MIVAFNPNGASWLANCNSCLSIPILSSNGLKFWIFNLRTLNLNLTSQIGMASQQQQSHASIWIPWHVIKSRGWFKSWRVYVLFVCVCISVSLCVLGASWRVHSSLTNSKRTIDDMILACWYLNSSGLFILILLMILNAPHKLKVYQLNCGHFRCCFFFIFFFCLFVCSGYVMMKIIYLACLVLSKMFRKRAKLLVFAT